MSRRVLLALGITGVTLGVAAFVVAGVAWLNSPPSEEDCRDQLRSVLEDGEAISGACSEWFAEQAGSVEELSAAVEACHTAVAEQHATRWTVPLEFTSTDTEPSGREIVVSGGAEFVTGQGDIIERQYSCLVDIGGEPQVRTVDLDR